MILRQNSDMRAYEVCTWEYLHSRQIRSKLKKDNWDHHALPLQVNRSSAISKNLLSVRSESSVVFPFSWTSRGDRVHQIWLLELCRQVRRMWSKVGFKWFLILVQCGMTFLGKTLVRQQKSRYFVIAQTGWPLIRKTETEITRKLKSIKLSYSI